MDERLFSLELRISKFLRYGVILAGLLMFTGWMTQIRFVGNPFLKFHDYQKDPFSHAVSTMYAHGQWGLLFSSLGLVVLLCLPTMRVVMTAVLFLRQRQFTLAAVATFVFLALLTSLYLGFSL